VHPSEIAHPRNTYVFRLQSVRGLAAIVVAFYHSLQAFPPDPRWARLYRGLMNIIYGPGAVFTFLILSGFVLGLSLARHRDRTFGHIWPFLVRRFWRLWPAIFVLSIFYEILGWIFD
jgi:peptidoglycan/LPS O-acetylase OafA/YrhL